ncbi:tRNA 2-thiouridine(34) synthase MnmA [Candidatus Pacearchaeota archaeon]|nr:tRNA 2-thiouridine(34) synthase MnmA [Candidatus Pacearchaeota archaeon]
MKTVVIGMSGGVDSSVAALLLKKQGYNVIGAFMKNFSDTKNKITGECAWRDEQKMAQKVALILKIPLVTFDFEKEYKDQVIEPMFRDYKRGLTPNPDILCNTLIKFPLFWKEAKKLGADYIAMGHYARIKKTKKGFQLLAGRDKKKDQSYFLYELSQEDLSHTLFPLGNYTKEEVRDIARKKKFPNADKPGTKGICFVGKVDMQQFLKKRIPSRQGKVISPKKEIIGIHPGASYYTIGQRIGPSIGINFSKEWKNLGERWYVADKKGNTIIAAPENHPLLKKKKIYIINFNHIAKMPKVGLKARIRHLGSFNAGKLKNNTFTFSKPVESIAEGQSIVIYHKNSIVGGGQIRLR